MRALRRLWRNRIECSSPIETVAVQTSPSLVHLTRRVGFSSGHRYWSADLSAEENRARFGPFASPYNHGHNYLLDVTISGRVDPVDGMVMNIKDLDDLLRFWVVSLFDGKSINDEVPGFETKPPSLENLLDFIWARVHSHLSDTVELVRMRLEEMPSLYAEQASTPSGTVMTLSRTYEFAASHRLHVPAYSDLENWEMFGKCNNPAGHGHNYILEITVEGQPDPVSGMMVDLDELDRKVNEEVVNRYDHKNLNIDIPELQGCVATSEVVAQKIFERLSGNLPVKLQRIRLHETARSCFEVVAES